MGICLDTEREKNGSQEFELQGRGAWLSEEGDNFRYANAVTPPDGQFPMQNAGPVKFEPPSVPVIFVLGGPGSGKVTHCDNLMQEKRGIVHINMTDLLQQYTIGNADMKDFSQLSSKTVTEVLMLEMKMSPAAKTYLVSGYPRNMRDVVEYSNKIQTVNGVVVVAWRQKVLERQIDYGAKLGHVVLSLAKMELANFFKNVMPVADYFDQRGMVIAVNGERNPAEVYNDFRAAVLRILGPLSNGVPPMPAPTTAVSVYNPPAGHDSNEYPPVIWVIGGPGSNKSKLCQRVVKELDGWEHVSLGRLLRSIAEGQEPNTLSEEVVLQLRQSIAAGEMAPKEVVMQVVDSQIVSNMHAVGIILDGFPREMSQVQTFEEKYEQEPVIILLDCSKLQLGRGRLDDSIAAFRRRLELFREQTLPMLKTLDDQNRLIIIDGDTDSVQVQDEFAQKLLQQADKILKGDMSASPHHPNGDLRFDNTTIQDLEDDGQEVHHPVANGYGPPTGVSDIERTFAEYNRTNQANGGLFGGPTLPTQNKSSNYNAQFSRYPMDSNM
ncbi:adenylate kinase isoenzyme 5 [Lycorma delicatula]|uniref:adenylate kinase isoenzyme 5 n=1 Tax=Lycorma delicatula TaxID=130591 RepID=UPI003F518FAC